MKRKIFYPLSIRREVQRCDGEVNRIVFLEDESGCYFALWSERSERMLEKGYTFQGTVLQQPPELLPSQHLCRVHLLRWLNEIEHFLESADPDPVIKAAMESFGDTGDHIFTIADVKAAMGEGVTSKQAKDYLGQIFGVEKLRKGHYRYALRERTPIWAHLDDT